MGYFLANLDLSLQDLLVQRCQELLCAIDHRFVNLSRQRRTFHLRVPHIHHDENVFHSHFLQECEELLAAAFLRPIFVAFLNELILIFNLYLGVHLRDPICKHLGFGCADLPPLLQVTQAQINLILVLDGS